MRECARVVKYSNPRKKPEKLQTRLSCDYYRIELMRDSLNQILGIKKLEISYHKTNIIVV